MNLFHALRVGTLGAEIVLPPDIDVGSDEENSFQFSVPGMAAGWWVFFFPYVFLDLSDQGWPSLRRDVERTARALFEPMVGGETGVAASPQRFPRLADPSWSPLVECERVSVD